MTDLETRLRDSLHRAAADAPSAVGLVARVRARRRPRPGLVTGLGAGLAVATAVVAVAVLPSLTDAPGVPDETVLPPVAQPSEGDGWRTVTVAPPRSPGARVDVDIPPSWTRDSLSVRETALMRTTEPPGAVDVGIDSWSGFVMTDGVAVLVDVMVGEESESTARRVLSSVRPEDAPAPDLGGWRTETVSDAYGEITVQVPEDPRVGVVLEEGLPDCEPRRAPAEPDGDGGWTASLCRDRIVTVTAPTQALADVVAATVEGW